ncbi:RidA family protein [Shewanella gelidii]|uniref:RidA family protein n=1 Tax=Shewanella gelidii TaxID=1642821 RepID=A0A917N6L9_9GAMM|nr:RidA family protein [Shewanella gelidii]MCL1096697.1 RidA family protein [Shewanella gelidii]GGI69565.1 hypothetical protein GCM10009332_03320 [Shewanella gelidii]
MQNCSTFLSMLFASLALAFGAANVHAEEHHYFPSDSHPNLPFSEAVSYAGVLYLSGSIGLTSKGRLAEGGITPETHQTMDNIQVSLKKHQLDMDDLLKCTVFLTDMSEWPAFNKAYASYFEPGHFPARSAMAVSKLALNAKVEVECIAALN